MTTYRRPAIENTEDFWFISQEKWDIFLRGADSNDAKQKKNALNNLRKFDAAGRIMETKEGRTAATPCFWCRRFTDQASCRLFATRADRACAYCKRFNKTSCSAIAETEEETATRAERLAAEKERLVAENESLTDRVGRQERRIARLETSFGQLQDLAAQVHSLASNADSRVAEVEGGIGQLRGTPGIASGRLDQLESEFSRAYAKARSHEDQLALLESHLAEHQAYIKGMKAKESSRSGNTAGSSSFRAF